jgi:hypothetical protein
MSMSGSLASASFRFCWHASRSVSNRLNASASFSTSTSSVVALGGTSFGGERFPDLSSFPIGDSIHSRKRDPLKLGDLRLCPGDAACRA